MKLPELIERLEGATHADRGLDRAIHREVSKCLIADETFIDGYGNPNNRRVLTYAYPFRWLLLGCPRYTSSLDAAMALVPNGASVHLHLFSHYDGASSQAVVGANHKFTHSIKPIALCVAALKARAKQEADRFCR